MLRLIRNFAVTGATTLPLAIAAICLMCILLAMIVLHASREQVQR